MPVSWQNYKITLAALLAIHPGPMDYTKIGMTTLI